jgi:hypothetical protein
MRTQPEPTIDDFGGDYDAFLAACLKWEQGKEEEPGMSGAAAAASRQASRRKGPKRVDGVKVHTYDPEEEE